MEGSNFWQFLVLLDTSDKSIFRQILATSTILSQIVASVIESKLYGLHMKSQSKRSANIEVIQALTSSKYEPGKAPQVLTSVEAEVAKESIGGILIGVTASRATFPTRVAEILQTWAKDLPQDIHVRFYVGDLTEKNTSYTDGSDADIANLALQAGISDKSMIVVMKGAQDNEYPLVQKAAAVLNHMDQATVQLDRQSDKSEIKWLFDVDDDTYVNVDGLKRFLSNRSIDQHTYIGRRGMGARKDREMLRKGGLTRPYCMGGTGILMAKDTFRVLVENIQKCIVDAKVTQDVVYDDVVFGTCLQRHLGIGCWDEKSYRSDTFAHNFHGSSHFPRNSALRDTITLHPHKTPGLMTKTHERFTRFVYTTAPMDESSGLLGFLLRVVWR